MNTKSYENKAVTVLEFAELFDVSLHAEQQCGMFKNSALSECKQAMLLGIAPAMSVIAYQNDAGKLEAICQSDFLNHLLALFFPTEMGISIERTLFEYIPRLELSESTSIITKTSHWLNFRRKCEKLGATDEELQHLEVVLESFGSYKINIQVYKSLELATLASRLR